MHGQWRTTPEQYVTAVRRYSEEIGMLEWAAPQDMMCEPFMLAKTGLTATEHQAHTVGNYLRLRELAPDLPFIPVLQGWQLADYLACVTRYERVGIDLTGPPWSTPTASTCASGESRTPRSHRPACSARSPPSATPAAPTYSCATSPRAASKPTTRPCLRRKPPACSWSTRQICTRTSKHYATNSAPPAPR